MNKRKVFDIYASIPAMMPKSEKNIFTNALKEMNIKMIISEDENERVKIIKNEKFNIIIVGNVGQLNDIVDNDTLAVMVYHGIGLKQSYYNDIDNRIDLRSVESKSRMLELKEHGHQNLVLTGFTKCDPLVKSENFLHLESMGLNPKQKTVLYAPSFYPSSLEQLLPFLQNITYETNLIVKLHNFSWHQDKYLYQSESIMELSKNFDNIFLVPPEEFNIIPYYRISDLLVSDISSTIFEYLYLNRPIIMADCFKLRTKHKIFNKRFFKKIDIERMENIDFTLRLSNPEDLTSLVYKGLEYPLDLENERLNAQIEYLYRVDGEASVRLVNAIENIEKNK
jgi:CDP-glycerol glycerophosphotransferase (TagB/SpsB family)